MLSMHITCYMETKFPVFTSIGWRMKVCSGVELKQADLKRQGAGELAIMRIDCTSRSRGGFRVLESAAWLDLLSPVLLWQAIIRQKPGTARGDN